MTVDPDPHSRSALWLLTRKRNLLLAAGVLAAAAVVTMTAINKRIPIAPPATATPPSTIVQPREAAGAAIDIGTAAWYDPAAPDEAEPPVE